MGTETRHGWRLRGSVVGTLVMGVCLWAGFSGPLPAHAAPTTYYFHGGPADDATRAAMAPTATFDTTAPTGATDSMQTGSVDANPDAYQNPLAVYWQAPFTGTINGTLHLDWWWSTTNAEAIAIGDSITVTVYADGTKIGQGSSDITLGATPVENQTDIPNVSGTVASLLNIQVTTDFVDTGNANTVHYNSTSAPSFFQFSTSTSTPTPTVSSSASPTANVGNQGNQLFHNYQAPYPYPHQPTNAGVTFLIGEPSIGVDWGTTAAGSNLTMYQGDLNTWQIHFDYSVKPPTANWLDRSDIATDTASLDPRLTTDHAGRASDRTIVDQLANGNSSQAYTDSDGGTTPPNGNAADWVASVGGGIPSGPDHESTGAGRYTSPPPTGVCPGGVCVYPHAVYYCSQAELLNNQQGPIDFCSRSDNGGASYGNGVATWTQAQCGGLHGKPRVGPDGVVYLPNKDCSGAGGAGNAKGVAISTDDGATWTVHNIPNTGTDCNQSDPDIAVGGNTGNGVAYYAYRDGDKKAKVVTSTDDGQHWSTPFDIGAAFGIQTIQFPEVIAGDANRAAVTFIGTQTAAPHSGCTQGDHLDDLSDNFGCPSDTATGCGAVWDLYVAFTYDGGQTWQTVDATPTLPVQRGGVCMNGTGCSGSDRNMLDFNDETIDNQGRVQIAYTDGCTAACETSPTATSCPEGNENCMGKFSSVFSMVDQVCGLGLFKTFDPGFNNDNACVVSTNVPEVPIVTGVAGAGLTAVAIAVFVRRRRSRKLAEIV